MHGLSRLSEAVPLQNSTCKFPGTTNLVLVRTSSNTIAETEPGLYVCAVANALLGVRQSAETLQGECGDM